MALSRPKFFPLLCSLFDCLSGGLLARFFNYCWKNLARRPPERQKCDTESMIISISTCKYLYTMQSVCV